MPSYLVIGSYTPEGVKGVVKNGGTQRADAVRSAVEALGGTMHSFHFAFGADDVFTVFDLPDNTAAAALGLAVAATGLVAIRIVVLVSPAEIDEAAKRQVSYQPPGKSRAKLAGRRCPRNRPRSRARVVLEEIPEEVVEEPFRRGIDHIEAEHHRADRDDETQDHDGDR